MTRALVACFATCAFLISTERTRAHHFAIDLEVSVGKEKTTAHALELGLGTKPKARQVMQIKSGARVRVKWKLANSDPKGTYKDVLVHFFVVNEEKLGQTFVPKLDKGVVTESALTMDFGPKENTEGEAIITAPKAGSYLLRLETIGAAVGKDGHEHFAAIDLDVR